MTVGVLTYGHCAKYMGFCKMNLFYFLLRAGTSLGLAFSTSIVMAVIFLGYSNYQFLDRIFIVGVPTISLAYLSFEVWPSFWAWLAKKNIYAVILSALLALTGSTVWILPVAVSNIYYISIFVFAIILFISMIPTISSVERVLINRDAGYIIFSWLLSLAITYLLVSLALSVTDNLMVILALTLLLSISGTIIGYHLAGRAAKSFRLGFLHSPFAVVVVLALPIFVAGVIYLNSQFPAMFTATDVLLNPGQSLSAIMAVGLASFGWSVLALEKFNQSVLYNHMKQTKPYAFVKENIPGFYAAIMFSYVYFIQARVINQPNFALKRIIFESDPSPWLLILGLPEGSNVGRAVHPLVLITLRQIVNIARIFTGEKWHYAPALVVAVFGGLCIFIAWLFLKRQTGRTTHAFLFSTLLGASTAHMLFASVVETYIFAAASLLFFYLILQSGERRFSILAPAGLLVFGVTITNIAQSIIGLFFVNLKSARLIKFIFVVMAAGVLATAFSNVLYPGMETFFFVPSDLAFESRYTEPVYNNTLDLAIERADAIGGAMFFFGVVAPVPIETRGSKSGELIVLQTYNYASHTIGKYVGLAYIPLLLWTMALLTAIYMFIKNFKTSPHTPFMLAFLGCLGFNFLLHMNYGTEMLLYTPNWTYALALFVALALADFADHRWFLLFTAVLVLTILANNAWFMFIVIKLLAIQFGGV
jgi:hypothetical protein